MSVSELPQFTILAEVDDLTQRIRQWADAPGTWQPLTPCQSLLRRILSRAETLRVRLENPLVVATFGGTGTGKSSLVNALVGSEGSTTGRQRPTTTRPILLVHPKTPLEALGMPLESVDIKLLDSPVLRDIVLLDCPDPDSDEEAVAETNLQRLRRLMPFCDVLIYTSTQQKYRSARVLDELSRSAPGCRLVFVQTHADIDSDIRDDWRQQLTGKYEIPEMFFIDSVKALSEQQAGQHPGGEFGRLLDLLSHELGHGQRVHIRRANLLDLYQGALEYSLQELERELPKVERLEKALEEQRQGLQGKVAQRLLEELKECRHLWERRLLTEVTEKWGLSPFSAVLRVYNGLGGLLASAGLSRVRSTAQLALFGVLQGARWWHERQGTRVAEERFQNLAHLGFDENWVREAQWVIEGFVRDAQLTDSGARPKSPTDHRQTFEAFGAAFMDQAAEGIENIIQELAQRQTRWYRRGFYEIAWLLLAGFIIYRIGKNFFWDSFLGHAPVLTFDFYIPAAGFAVLWAGILVMLLASRTRKGLDAHLARLAQKLATTHMGSSLDPVLAETCQQVHQQVAVLRALREKNEHLRKTVAQGSTPVLRSSGLGRSLRPDMASTVRE